MQKRPPTRSPGKGDMIMLPAPCRAYSTDVHFFQKFVYYPKLSKLGLHLQKTVVQWYKRLTQKLIQSLKEYLTYLEKCKASSKTHINKYVLVLQFIFSSCISYNYLLIQMFLRIKKSSRNDSITTNILLTFYFSFPSLKISPTRFKLSISITKVFSRSYVTNF